MVNGNAMAVEQKPTSARPTADLTQLDNSLRELAAATTPAQIIRLLTAGLSQLPQSVAAAGFGYGPDGHQAFLDETELPARQRGRITYPEAAEENAASWPQTPAAQAVQSKLTADATQLVWLEARGRRFGGLVLWHHDQELRPASVACIQALVRQGSMALHTLALEETLQRHQAETEALQRITRAITRSLDFDKVVSTLLDHTQELFHVEAVSLLLVEGDSDILTIYQSIGLSDQYTASLRIDRQSPTAQAIATGKTATQIYDASAGAVSGQAKLIQQEGLKSMLTAPIFTGSELVGALVAYSKTPRHFLSSELHLIQSLAEQTSIAFANAKLHASLINVSNEIEQTRNLMQDGLLVLDPGQHLRYFNAAAGTLLNLTPDSVMKPFGALLERETTVRLPVQELSKAVEAALHGQLGRTNFRTTEPSVRHFEAIYSPYRDINGKLIGVIINIRDITSLYLEKEKLRTIQANIQDGLIMIDAQSNTIECNDQWRQLFAVEGDLVGRNFFAEATERADLTFDQNLVSLVATVLTGKRLMCYGHFTERERHIQISLAPIMTGGKVSGAVATARDITPLVEKTLEANKMTTKAQRHLQELTQLAELSAIVGFNVSNIYKKYLAKIASLLESSSVSVYLYEQPNHRLIRQQTINPHESDKPVMHLGEDHVMTDAILSSKGVSGDKQEEAGGYHHMAMPIIHHGKTLGVLLIGRISERHYGEHDAKLLRLVATRLAVLIENANLYHDVNARRERWEAVFRFTDEGIVIFDREGTIVGFNPASTEITQWDTPDAIGRPFDKIVKTVNRDGHPVGPSPLMRVLEEGITIAKSEQLIEGRTGSHLWTEISYSPIFDDTGKVTSGIAIIRNVQKDREVEEIKSDFISIVSHELRTPLTAIKGFLSMVLKQDFGGLTDKQFHYLSRVYQSNQRMIDLVEDLLDVSYIESGKTNLTINPVALETVLNEVISELAGKGAGNQIMIKVNRRKRLPLVLADETRLHQILLNLVDNAIKYSMPGTQVEIDFKIQGDELITTVADHGVGITKSQLDRLFTKFGRIYNPMSVQAGGTGLGLYIVKNLIESHGGRIWVTSWEGKGSKFRFTLPIAKQLPLID
jgi:PAS domain S-box-containing protein